MRIIDRDLCWGYPEDPTLRFDFGRFADQASDFLLAPCAFYYKELRGEGRLSKEKRIIHVQVEEPNGFFLPETHSCYEYEDRFERILTLCPFTAKWGNERVGWKQRRSVFFPTNETLLPGPKEKTIPVIYTGNMVGGESGLYLQTAKNLNGCTVCYGAQAPVSYTEKLALIAHSKMTIVHNLLFFTPGHMDAIKAHPGDLLTKNRAFERGYSEYIAPQLKSRGFEAAFCRSLILCRKDPWNLIEEWFTPGVDIIYFEPKNLVKTIQGVLANYESYQPMIEHAYKKAMLMYTTRRFFEVYLKGE